MRTLFNCLCCITLAGISSSATAMDDNKDRYLWSFEYFMGFNEDFPTQKDTLPLLSHIKKTAIVVPSPEIAPQHQPILPSISCPLSPQTKTKKPTLFYCDFESNGCKEAFLTKIHQQRHEREFCEFNKNRICFWCHACDKILKNRDVRAKHEITKIHLEMVSKKPNLRSYITETTLGVAETNPPQDDYVMAPRSHVFETIEQNKEQRAKYKKYLLCTLCNTPLLRTSTYGHEKSPQHQEALKSSLHTTAIFKNITAERYTMLKQALKKQDE